MKSSSITLIGTLFLVLLSVSACMLSAQEKAQRELNRMDAEEYFRPQAQAQLAKASEQGDVQTMKAAIARGADVNFIGKEGMATLYWPLLKRNLEGFKYLLEAGADPHTRTDLPPGFQDPYASAMDMAATDPDPRYLEALLAHGADPNLIINNSNQPILYRAILHDRLKNVRLLIERDADLNHQDNMRKTPLLYAVTTRQFEIALYLLRNGSDPTIEYSLGGGPIDIVKKYRAGGVVKGSNDETAYDHFVKELHDRGHLSEEEMRKALEY